MNTERVNILLQMIHDDPNDPFLYYGLVLEYSYDYQYDNKSIEVLENLRASHPDYLPLYYQLATLYRKTGEQEAAKRVARSGLLLAEKQGNRHTFSELDSLLDDLD